MKNKIYGYCLTIKDSERHKHMEKMLCSVKDLSYEFIYAKKFSKSFVENVVNPSHQVWNLSQFSKEDTYLERAYSCSEGHRRIMETFLNQNEYDWALVMEDDLLLGENIIEQLNYVIDTYNYDWYHLSTEAFFNYLKEIKPFPFQENPQLIICNRGNSTLCYLVNKTFALKYYKNLTPILAPSDITLWCNNKECPIIKNVNVYFSEDQKKSTIGQ